MAAATTPRTSGGSTLSISATLPASIAAADYGALSATLVGEVTNIGELGKVWSTTAHQALAKKAPDHFKATYDEPAVTIQAAYVPGDAGQIIVKAAVESSNAYTFKVILPDNETRYMMALVLSATHIIGASGDIIGSNIQIQPLNDTAVIVAAS